METTLTDEQIQKIIQDAQTAAQQAAAQVLQAAQQTGGSLSADKKALGFTAMTEDTGSDEANKQQQFVDSQMWGYNKKMLVESASVNQRAFDLLAIKEKELQIAEREAKLRKQASLDHIEVIAQLQQGIFNTAVNMEYAKFNAAISEPINPNIGGKKAVI